MPYLGKPVPGETVAKEVLIEGWLQCGCRERLGYVTESSGATIILYCRKCKMHTQFHLGYKMGLETA